MQNFNSDYTLWLVSVIEQVGLNLTGFLTSRVISFLAGMSGIIFNVLYNGWDSAQRPVFRQPALFMFTRRSSV